MGRCSGGRAADNNFRVNLIRTGLLCAARATAAARCCRVVVLQCLLEGGAARALSRSFLDVPLPLPDPQLAGRGRADIATRVNGAVSTWVGATPRHVPHPAGRLPGGARRLPAALRHARSRPPHFPPGPLRLPVWGNLWQLLLRNYRHPHKALLSLSQDFGSAVVGVYAGSTPVVVANDFETVRDMLAHPAFQGRPTGFTVRVRAFDRLHGIFFTDGKYWEQQRRFSLRHMRDHGFGRRFERLEAIVQEELQGVVQILKGCLGPYDKDVARDGLVLLPDVFAAASMNMVLAVLTGARLGVEDFPAMRAVARQVLGFQRAGNAAGLALDSTPWLRFLAPALSGFSTYKAGNDALMAFLAGHMHEHKQTFDAEAVRGFYDQYVIEMKDREGEDSTFTELQLLLTLMDYTFPTATAIPSALSFAVVYMMQHPEMAERAHKEINDVVGLGRLPDLNDRVNLPYTEAFLREVLRLSGTPLGVTHRATEDSYFRGYFVPKDSLIVPNMWAAHRDPSFFEKPLEFQPQRFLLTNGQLKRKDITVPFGLGKRLCAGETFARQNMFLFLAAMLQGFHFAMPEGSPSLRLDEDALFGFIFTPPDDLCVRVTERA